MRMFLKMAVVATALAGLALSTVAAAAPPELTAVQARVEFNSMDEWREFVSLPGLDIMRSKPGVGVTIVTDADQISELRGLGYHVTIEIPDMRAHYRTYAPREDFGDYYTYSEMLDFMDALHAAYPSITTARDSIGTTHEGRALWVMEISDNPGVDEGEPEVLFDALHHAREVVTPATVAYYMQWLCENYGTDSEATFLVDNRAIWFLPIVNPDGFVYNELNGWGSMWRKNRRDNEGSSCYGVDNNRNYPYMWGYSGVDYSPCGETYLGPWSGSEPENQGYINFCADHDFVTNISFHSVSAMILLPWGYDYSVHTPDDALFREICNTMSESNGYEVGQAGEILYDCAGTTCDWFYAEHGCLSVCIEVSGSGFWPSDSELPGLVAENLWPQQYMTRIAGSYLALRDNYTIAGGNGDQNPDPGETLDLAVTIDNQGVAMNASNVVVTLETDDAYVQLNDASSSLGNIAARGYANNAADPFSFTIDPSTPDGHGLKLRLEITADDFSAEDEIVWMVGSPTLVFSDDMENGTGNWIESDGLWGLTGSQSHSPSTSYTDSPGGQYGNNRNTWIELADPIDFSNAAAAELRFWQRVNTEANWDFCYVEGSTDGGTTWTQIGEKYDGDWPWSQVVLPLDDFVGTADFSLRFRFDSDTYVTDDGWYIDDVEIYGPSGSNAPPSAPGLSDPPDGGTVTTSTPTLTVTNATDSDQRDVLTYGFVVYADELCTTVVTSTSGVAEGANTTSWVVDIPLSNDTYYWRAYADDGTERGPLMSTASFSVDATGVNAATRLALRPAQPNPFGSETTLSFELPAASNVTLAVYSVDGRLVRTLAHGNAGPGPVEVTWDGKNESGERVSGGLYFLRLLAGDEVRYGKLVVLR